MKNLFRFMLWIVSLSLLGCSSQSLNQGDITEIRLKDVQNVPNSSPDHHALAVTYLNKAKEQEKVITKVRNEKNRFEKGILARGKHFLHRSDVVVRLRDYDQQLNQAQELKSEYEKLSQKHRELTKETL